MEVKSLLSQALQCDDATRERQRKAMEQFEKAERQKLQEEHKTRMTTVNSSIPQNQHNLTFGSIRTKGKDPSFLDAMNLCQNWTPEEEFGIILVGPTGTGKTHLLRALCLKWASSHYQATLREMRSLFEAIFADLDNRENLLRSLLAKDMICLDDFGVEKVSDFSQATIFDIVNRALIGRKHIFLTSNMTYDEFKRRYSGRIFDRLNQMCVFKEVKGESHRKFYRNHNDRRAKELMGV
jgi:DNA replication protein DnaC